MRNILFFIIVFLLSASLLEAGSRFSVPIPSEIELGNFEDGEEGEECEQHAFYIEKIKPFLGDTDGELRNLLILMLKYGAIWDDQFLSWNIDMDSVKNHLLTHFDELTDCDWITHLDLTGVLSLAEKYKIKLDLSKLKKLKKLTHLKLGRNHLTALPDFVYSFNELKYLDLLDNDFRSRPWFLSRRLPKLETLFLEVDLLEYYSKKDGNLTTYTTIWAGDVLQFMWRCESLESAVQEKNEYYRQNPDARWWQSDRIQRSY